jgi:hypothetical protein
MMTGFEARTDLETLPFDPAKLDGRFGCLLPSHRHVRRSTACHRNTV